MAKKTTNGYDAKYYSKGHNRTLGTFPSRKEAEAALAKAGVAKSNMKIKAVK